MSEHKTNLTAESLRDGRENTRECPTEGCDGITRLAVPEAQEFSCESCGWAYILLLEQGWVGGVER